VFFSFSIVPLPRPVGHPFASEGDLRCAYGKFLSVLLYHKNDLQKTKINTKIARVKNRLLHFAGRAAPAVQSLAMTNKVGELNMAVPKKKKSAAKSKQHCAHNALAVMESMKCPKCGEKKRPHHVCAACGAYGDLTV